MELVLQPLERESGADWVARGGNPMEQTPRETLCRTLSGESTPSARAELPGSRPGPRIRVPYSIRRKFSP